MRKSSLYYHHALLLHRATPLGPNLPSPAELMYNRNIQSNLPIRVTGKVNDEIRNKMLRINRHSEERYNTHSKPLPELNMNKDILYQDVARKNGSKEL